MVNLHITKLRRVHSILSAISADFFLKQKEKNVTGKKSLVTDIIFPNSLESEKKTARDLGV